MNQHLPELDEIAMRLVVDFDGTPGVGTTADSSTVGSGDVGVGADDGEGDFTLSIEHAPRQICLAYFEYAT